MHALHCDFACIVVCEGRGSENMTVDDIASYRNVLTIKRRKSSFAKQAQDKHLLLKKIHRI
jgi:hypothetical protein